MVFIGVDGVILSHLLKVRWIMKEGDGYSTCSTALHVVRLARLLSFLVQYCMKMTSLDH